MLHTYLLSANLDVTEVVVATYQQAIGIKYT